MITFYVVFTVISGFDYYNSYQSPEYNAPSSPNDNVWKYTAETTAVAPTQKTEEWQKHVNSAGITSWDDHLRSQGIDPVEHQKSLTEGAEREQWYNPMLECKQGHQFNGDTAPPPDKKMKYMATPSYPSRTMGVFQCKWTIQRGPAPLLKLIFAMIDFECNGLNPTVQSWGTANHIQITDRGQVKSIYCGKKKEPAFYTDSKEVQVEIQVNTAGFGKRGSRVQIIYQSVRARGTPRTTAKPRLATRKQPTQQPIIPGGYTLAPPPGAAPQPPAQNEPIPPRPVPNNIPANRVNSYHPMQPNYDVNTQSPYLTPHHHNQMENFPPEHFPPEFSPPGSDQAIGANMTTTAAPDSSNMLKSTIGLAVGGVIVLIVAGVAMFLVRAMKRKIASWKRPAASSAQSNNVVTFVNELVSSNVKTVSEEPLNHNTLQHTNERKS